MKGQEVILELCDELGKCSGGIADILKDSYQLEKSQYDYAILENFAFLLAYLHYEDGIDDDEAGSCISCFVGVNIGVDVEKFKFIANSADFYSKIFYAVGKGRNYDFLVMSKIIYNLLHPGERNTFENSLPIINGLDVVDKGVKIRSFLSEDFPKRVNSILSKM